MGLPRSSETMRQLTDEQVKKAFWTWVYYNASSMMPEAKRYLGNEDLEDDFQELIGGKKPTVAETNEFMAQVSFYAIKQAMKELGKKPYWFPATDERLWKSVRRDAEAHRY